MSTANQQERLEIAIAAFLEAVDGGEPITPEEWIVRHPDLSLGLTEFFADQAEFDCQFQFACRPFHDTAGGARNSTSAGMPGNSQLKPNAPDDEVQILGDFDLVREIGRGAMGVVYEARQRSLDRTVAVKMLRTDLLASVEELHRIKREAELAARLDHPGIVPVYEVNCRHHPPYLVMKLIRGGNLADRSYDYCADPIAAARLMLTIAHAVEHAHQRGVLHRDLKPANVLINDDGSPHVADFGLARQLESDSEITRTGVILGTPAYMAPEQADAINAKITTATDVYGMGAMLYDLLTGVPPFRGKSVLDTLDQVRRQAPISTNSRNSAVPKDLDIICRKCLEKEPNRRYQSASALADDLSRFIDSKPIAARPTPLIEHFQLWRRRDPVLASLSVTVCLLTLILFAGSMVASVLLAQANTKTLSSLEREIVAKGTAKKKEELALRALYEAHVAQARSGRFSGRPGQRIEGLDAIEKASSLWSRLQLDSSEKLRLRNLAIACMSLVDIKDDQNRPSVPRNLSSVDQRAELIAYPEVDRNAIQIRRLADDVVIQRLNLPPASRAVATAFSPDSRFLFARCQNGEPRERNIIWDVSHPQPILDVEGSINIRNSNFGIFDFSPDSTRLAYSRANGSVEIRERPSWNTLMVWPSNRSVFSLRFNPTGKLLAIRQSDNIYIIDIEKRAIERKLNYKAPAATHRMAWSPDGRMIAESCWDKSTHVIDSHTGRLLQTLGNHAEPVANVEFHPRGDIVVTDSWDNASRVWSLADGRQLLRINERFRQFSRDGRWLGYANGRYEMFVPQVYRTGFQPTPEFVDRTAINVFAMHPDGRLLVVGNRQHTVFWDLATTSVVHVANISARSVHFSPDGKTLFTKDQRARVSAFPVHRTESETRVLFQIAPPKRLVPTERIQDGDHQRPAFASTILSKGNTVHIIDTAQSRVHKFTVGHANADVNTGVAPDGRLFVTGTYKGQDVKLWDGVTGELKKTIAVASATAVFSPDGKVLAVSQGGRSAFYSVATGKLLRETAPKQNAGIFCGRIVYSSDGAMIAIGDRSQNVIKLLAANTYRELATFELPEDQIARNIAFSADDGWLVAAVSDNSILHFWNLRKLRSKLGVLDWNLPALPDPIYDSTKPMHAEVISENRVRINPTGRSFRAPVDVSIDSPYENSVLYYTLNGDQPTPESSQYRGPITIAETSTLQVLVCDEDDAPIAAASAGFVINPNLLPLDDLQWKVWDVPDAKDGPSKWKVHSNTVLQTSGIWCGTPHAHGNPTVRRDGTLRIYQPASDVTNATIRFQFNTSDDDTLGVAFRLTDEEHYYLYSVDKQRKFHVLARCDGDDYQILARVDGTYKTNQWNDVRIELRGSRITIMLNGKPDLQAEDSSFTKGTIALYTYGCEDVRFRNIAIESGHLQDEVDGVR